MEKLFEFLERRKLKQTKAAHIFGVSASHIGAIVAGRRKKAMTEAEAWYFSQIIDLYEAGRHGELRELKAQDLTDIRLRLGLNKADTSRLCGIEPSHWGHMERGDQITQRTSYLIQLKLLEREGKLPAQLAAKAEPVQAPAQNAAQPASRPSAVPPRDLDARGEVPSLPALASEQPGQAAELVPLTQAGLPELPPADAVTLLARLVGIKVEALEGQIAREFQLLRSQVAELAARVDERIDTRLSAAELERRQVAARRAHIAECVGVLVLKIAGGPSKTWYSRIWTLVHQAADVNKLDDIQSHAQADQALARLKQEASEVSCILPAYQLPLELQTAVSA